MTEKKENFDYNKEEGAYNKGKSDSTNSTKSKESQSIKKENIADEKKTDTKEKLEAREFTGIEISNIVTASSRGRLNSSDETKNKAKFASPEQIEGVLKLNIETAHKLVILEALNVKEPVKTYSDHINKVDQAQLAEKNKLKKDNLKKDPTVIAKKVTGAIKEGINNIMPD
jgi:hypothetical protein